MLMEYLRKTKGEVLNMFKRVNAMTEKPRGRLIKTFKINGGGGYNSHDFKQLCGEMASCMK